MSPSQGLGSVPRSGISELYASLLMVGVTLAVGGLVASSALGQLVMANDASSLSAMAQEASARIQLGLVYIVAVSFGSCPIYGGYHEGTTLEIAIYNYGGTPFKPAQMVLNGTVFAGDYEPLAPGSLWTHAIVGTACSHSSGQTLIMENSAGEEVQFES